jgi:hypothetical protein
MATWRFSVAGVSGGWLSWGSDTDYELRANALDALRAAGFSVSSFVLDVGDDLSARVARNSFPYRATVAIGAPLMTNSTQAATEVLDAFRQASGGNEPTLSELSIGEAEQPAPSTYFRTIGDVATDVGNAIGDAARGAAGAATFPLALVAVALVAVAVVVVRK